MHTPPPGWTWRETEIDERAIAGYRFDPSLPARLRAALDAAAAIYLLLALLAIPAGAAEWPPTAAARFARVVGICELRPLFAHPLAVFAFLLAGILVHESRLLKLGIYRAWLGSGRLYSGFTRSTQAGAPPRWQRAIGLASSVVNRIVVCAAAVVAADGPRQLRFSPWLRDSAVLDNVVFAGILLTVTGLAQLTEALESKAGPLKAAFEALASAALGAAAFGAVIGIGLGRGAGGTRTGLAFGGSLALFAWLARYLLIRRDSAELPESLRSILIYPEEAAMLLGRLVDAPLRAVCRIAGRLSKPPEDFTAVPSLVETVRDSGAGLAEGYLHPARLPPPPRDFAMRACAFGLHHLLTLDSSLTRWLRHEPVRPSPAGQGIWEAQDPLDLRRGVKRVMTFGGPPWDLVRELNRRLLSLMLSVRFLVYLAEIAVWHAVGVTGRPLLDRGAHFALLYGAGLGAVFGLLTILGNSSPGASMQGLVGGLSLDPRLGLASGFGYWVAHRSPDYAVTFVVTLLTTVLDRRALALLGLLLLLAGIWLQALPLLMPA